ncbi:hypothetical protein [Edaphobacter aggregans]|uniref:hypothetical protein n=1 Tax=Edaphobacter aggregans TaxID=570835 RepID=UPI0012F9CD59|nr:hypothetical protein [Edaphobacter aggregans]
MLQRIWLYEGTPSFAIEAELDGEASHVGTRHFDPLVIRQEDPARIASAKELRVLHVPFDNDMWFRFASRTVASIKEDELFSGQEVTAIYDDTIRQGIVIGSITHDTWKTAIDIRTSHGRLANIDVYGGISAPTGVRSDTHDVLAHGIVHGDRVISPRIFVGSFSDWRDGLDAYAEANAKIQPPLQWAGRLPAGWNSWAAYGGKIDYQRYLGAAQYVHDTLTPEGFGRNRTIYINLDAFWSRLDAVQLEDAVAGIRAMQASDGTHFEPGIYWTPFAYWSNNLDASVEGTDRRYRYRDILLKGPDGALLPKVDGGRPIDPSHPGTKLRTSLYLRELRRLGFTCLKIDFVTHGALEGTHYDPSVQTCIQAYNMGMKQIVEEAGGKMFLSLSIAPLFPSGYGHARRLSCDTKGHINGNEQSTEYMLNALTYGWWTNKRLYILDPDHVVLGEHGDLGARNIEEGKSRLLSAAISGGMVLDSSPLADDSQARSFAKAVYNQPKWYELASDGEAFRPVDGATGSSASNAFVRSSGREGHLALFNYDDKNPTTIRIPVVRILPPDPARELAQAVDTETGQTVTVTDGMIAVTLKPAESKLLTLTYRAQP